MNKHESYEGGLDRELSVKGLVVFTTGLIGLIVVSGALMWGLSGALRSMSASADPPPPALEEAREAYTPPTPRLQTDPFYEMDELRTHEAEMLESYGWVDEEAGIARIPIERALELYAAGELEMAVEPGAGDAATTATDEVATGIEG